MHRIWCGIACGLIALGLIELRLSPATAQGTGPSIVWLVRHAEKTKDPEPVLTKEGEKRAQDLVTCLGGKGVTAIITSDRKRTILTAAPLAAHLKITPAVVPLDESKPIEPHVDAAVKELRATPGKVLVVGHSDSVPGILKEMGKVSIAELKSFERLFVLDLGGPKAVLEELTYGAVPKGSKKKKC